MSTTTYSMDDARTAIHNATQRQSSMDSAWFGTDTFSAIERLMPIIDAAAEVHGINVIYGRSPTAEVTSCEQWHLAAGHDPTDSDHVIIAHQAYLHDRPDDRTQLPRGLTFACIRDHYQENATIPWHFATEYDPDTGDDPIPAYGGAIAPGLITVPFWVRSTDLHDDEQSLLFTTFVDAIAAAISPETVATWDQSQIDTLSGRYHEIVGNRTTAAVQVMASEIQELLDSNHSYEQRLASNNVRLDELRAQYHAIRDVMVPDDEMALEVSREMSIIREHPDIVSVSPGPDAHSIDIFTSQLPLQNIESGDTTIGGTYRVRVTFGAVPQIEVRNLTHRVGLYDHPHVSNGAFCLGDQRALVNSMVSRTELSAAIALIIDLLKQVNPGDVYTSDWEAWFDTELESS